MKNLLLISFLSFQIALFSQERITLTTEDGCILSGYQNIISTETPLLLEFHGLGSASSEWKKFNEFAKIFKINYIAIDFRGHGESVKCKNREIKYETMQEHDIKGFLKDIDSVYKFAEKKFSKEKIIPIGASIGANSAMEYFYKKSKKIILMSPGLNYGGYEIADFIKNSKTKILFTVSQTDIYSLNSIKIFLEICKSQKKKCDSILADKGHGVEIFNSANGENYIKEILNWIISK